MLLTFLLALLLFDVRNCACDVSRPETLEARNCSLCREAEKQPLDTSIFFLKDSNPSKPNRTLALPRKHTQGPHALTDLTAGERTDFFTAAITKGRELWGDDWGVAYNGVESRTQCHAHIHIGKLLPDSELAQTAEAGPGVVIVNTPSEIIVPTDGTGFWFHSVAGKIHVHSGAQITEFVLMR